MMLEKKDLWRNSSPHGARPVNLTITMIKWIRTSRLSITNSLFVGEVNRMGRNSQGRSKLPPTGVPRQ